MFFFQDHTDNEDVPNTSQERYQLRSVHFEMDKQKYPFIRHTIYWLIHNCVAHFLLGVFPTIATFDFHELTSQWLNHLSSEYTPFYRPKGLTYRYERMLYYKKPEIKNKAWWFFHNSVVHMLIGLMPIGLMFKLHDWSAQKMNVEGWGMIGLIVAASIAGYFMFGAALDGIVRSIENKSIDDMDGFDACIIVFWPFLACVWSVVAVSDVVKGFADNNIKRSLNKKQKKLADLKQVRVELEATNKELQEQQEIVKQLEKELETPQYGSR